MMVDDDMDQPSGARETGGPSEANESQAQSRDGTQPAPPAETAAEEELRRVLEAVKAQAAEYLEGWQRARAEFANYKRRIEKEQSEAYQNATARVVGRFLDVGDDFERAMQERPVSLEAPELLAQWLTGIELIQRKLQNILDAEGVERIQAEGQMFDPALHEAVTQEDSDTHAPGQVIGVVRQGYRIGERVIRPAMVRVAK